MPDRLSVSDIASIIAVEEEIVRCTLERRDEELLPYLHVEPIASSQNDEPQKVVKDAADNELGTSPSAVMLSVDGLPTLLTKLAFNIPTSDLIENLACQVLHLTVLQEENAELEREKHRLEKQNEKLRDRAQKDQSEVESLRTKLLELMELQSRGWIRNLFSRANTE